MRFSQRINLTEQNRKCVALASVWRSQGRENLAAARRPAHYPKPAEERKALVNVKLSERFVIQVLAERIAVHSAACARGVTAVPGVMCVCQQKDECEHLTRR